MAASLEKIYGQLGELTATVRALSAKIDANEKRNVTAITKADQSRGNMHRRLDDLVNRTSHLEGDMTSVKNKVEQIQSITDGVENMTQRAIGAGTLGQWAIKVGGWVVSALAGAAAVYTYLTGRPPP